MRIQFLFFISAFILISAVCISTLQSQKLIPTYVGINTCRKCHESNAIGNQYKYWASMPHAKAYQILNMPKAEKIANKIGIEKPADDLRCLKCHTTGGGRVKATRKEGVGCEACHGPGSRYFEFSNHASFENRDSAYRKAVILGMYPIIGIDGIKSREKVCRHCHNQNRPCIPESRQEIKRQILPLSIIADFVFRHPIRR